MALLIPDGYELEFTLVGQHRSETLALRHLKKLEKQYPFPEYIVRIGARRNAQGRFSAWGHFFTFEIWRIVEEEEEIEYEGAFDSP